MTVIVILILFWIFAPWVTQSGTLSAGDWPYLYFENIKEFSLIPNIHYLWLAPYYQSLTKLLVIYAGLSFEVMERLFWFLPFVVVSFWSAYRLTRSAIGALIYTTNTYALMIVGGGQMGVAMAYSLAPLIFKRFLDLIDDVNPQDKFTVYSLQFKVFLFSGLILALQMMFDPRIAAVTFGACLAYLLFQKISLKDISLGVLFPLGIALVVNLYWIVPLLISRASIEGQLSQATTGLLKFLSFATFSQTISLLHPNWPENIFGKIYFMRPEFLVLPILAFGNLILRSKIKDQRSKIQIKNQKNRNILFFALLALLGAFLAKGANPPFGGIYLWAFEKISGFSLFRDATKFYLLVVLAYSFLIPITITSLQERLPKRVTFALPLFFLVFWLFTIRQAVLGQLTGTFKPIPLPVEYAKLKEFLVHDSGTYSTLWIPERERFGFSSKDHEGLSLREIDSLAYDRDYLLDYLRDPKLKDLVNKKEVGYVIVPFDARDEIFLKDHLYDDTLRQELVASLSAVPWLRKKQGFGDISLFEVR